MAVMDAQMWCEKPENAVEMSQIAAKRNWINAPYADLIDRAKGKFVYGDGRIVEKHPDMMKYWDDFASYPYQSHDLWFLTENQRWGYQPADLDAKALIAKVNREDMWKDAAKALGVPAPTSTSRGKETFFDGKVFDPADPVAYLKSLAIKKVMA
jgi:nitrate/nitrite transport system substrate-binding protein